MVGIYKITNTVNGKVYIGQSINIKRRIYAHFAHVDCKSYGDSHSPHFHSAVRKYGKESFSWEVIEECEKSILDDRERYWIAYYDSTNREKGYNVMDGGNGRRHQNKEKPVVCIDIATRKMLKRFDTLGDAARFAGADRVTGICRCCKHMRGGKTYMGYMWCYESEYYDGIYDNTELIKPKPSRPVVALDKAWNFIKEYSSAKEAGIALGCDHCNIRSVANLHRRTVAGFRWMWADEYYSTFS